MTKTMCFFVCNQKTAYEITVCLEFRRLFFFFQAEDGIRDHCVTGVQTCALPISYPIALAGKDALRRKVLPLVARGRQIPAFALTEPGAGSSLGDVATSAKKGKRG